jgi:hypothetical protein
MAGKIGDVREILTFSEGMGHGVEFVAAGKPLPQIGKRQGR